MAAGGTRGSRFWNSTIQPGYSGKHDPEKAGPEGSRRTSFDFPPVDRTRLPQVLGALRSVSQAARSLRHTEPVTASAHDRGHERTCASSVKISRRANHAAAKPATAATATSWYMITIW